MTKEEEYNKLLKLEGLHKESLLNLKHFLDEFDPSDVKYFNQYIKLNGNINDTYHNTIDYQQELRVKYNFDYMGGEFASYFKEKFLTEEE